MFIDDLIFYSTSSISINIFFECSVNMEQKGLEALNKWTINQFNGDRQLSHKILQKTVRERSSIKIKILREERGRGEGKTQAGRGGGEGVVKKPLRL